MEKIYRDMLPASNEWVSPALGWGAGDVPEAVLASGSLRPVASSLFDSISSSQLSAGERWDVTKLAINILLLC